MVHYPYLEERAYPTLNARFGFVSVKKSEEIDWRGDRHLEVPVAQGYH
jgi:hypothetical protein